ncbi:unnamed protein product [Rotaria socialis]|uniref:F-box domain-containing protein n=1 Tax=Rotaria socialis TaxID=392032 RepID=A0A821USR9_9BILA|nr:unnamed protein product [Rotaria socialis]CAF4895346.1 unnamed protein product [Rotaria socialis]
MNSLTKFEDLSDEIIISIIEYLSLEDSISIFKDLNARLTCIMFDHPWTHHRLNIQIIDDKTLQSKLDFIETMKLVTRVSSIKIRPFSIYRSIQTFNQYKPLHNFTNLQTLSLNNITLEEAESIFTTECLSQLVHLTRLFIKFSFGIEQNNYCSRFECLISKILVHSSLQYVTIHSARPLEFTLLQLPSSIVYLKIDYCSLQSLYRLFEFTPCLRHLTATIVIENESNNQQLSIPSSLTSLTLIGNIPIFDDLIDFLRNFSNLQQLNIVSFSIIEPLTDTSFWFEFIAEYLPSLTKFKRESNVAAANIAAYIESFHWPNRWQLRETSVPNGSNCSRITIVNTRY